MQSFALVDGVMWQVRTLRVAAHFSIRSTGHHHRHSRVVRLRHDASGHGQDIVLLVVLGLHRSSSAEAELRIQIPPAVMADDELRARRAMSVGLEPRNRRAERRDVTMKVAHMWLYHSRMLFVRAFPRDTPGDGF